MDMKVSFRHPRLPEQLVLDARDMALVTLIQRGLTLSTSPYAELGRQLEMTEDEVISRISNLIDAKVIKRFGVVVRHHELGYRANAMVVWNIPDDRVSELGPCMGQFDFVTLCYRRPRRLPAWPYNLFTMIHGQDRNDVQHNIQALAAHCGLDELAFEVLFSTRRFKQRGAIYHKSAGEE